MMRRWVVAVGGMLLAGAAPLAGAGKGCPDDRGTDRCDPKEHARMLARFGAPSVEQHREAGELVRRAFYVDGHGFDVVGISFIRALRSDPVLKVFLRQYEEELPRPPMEAVVPAAVWQEVTRRSLVFDRAISPPVVAENVVTICVHGWVYVAETVDEPFKGSLPLVIRRKTENACENGLAEVFAEDLYKLAVPLLPHCALLDRRHYRNEAMLLALCGSLTGDRQAAAEAVNAWEDLEEAIEAGSAPWVERSFDEDVALLWGGEALPKLGEGAARLWLERLGSPAKAFFLVETMEGLDHNRVRFAGTVNRERSATGTEAGSDESAPFEQVWVRRGGRFLLSEATVGRFAPLTDP